MRFRSYLVLPFLFFFLTACGNSDNNTNEAAIYEVQPRMEDIPDEGTYTKIFLAGTIDMGNSVDWQRSLINKFFEGNGRYILFNPRRYDYKNTPEEMEYQVNWELDHLEKSDIIIMNILGSSKSPVTLLEMGLYMRSGKLYVACEPDYYRYDNVRITCAKYNVPLYDSLAELMQNIKF